MHELRPARTSVDVPSHRSVRGLLIDAAVAQIDVAVLGQLAGELDDFGVQDDLYERQGVIKGTPVRVFHLRPQVKVIPLATVCRPF